MLHAKSVGCDLGLATGAIAEVTLQLTARRMTLVNFRVLSSWNESLSLASHPGHLSRITRTFRARLTPLFDLHLVGTPVYVDWDVNEGNWGGKRNAILKSFALGIVYAWSIDHGLVPISLSPGVLRKSLHLAPRVQKEETWRRFVSLFKLSGSTLGQFQRLNEHEKDAILLAAVGLSASIEVISIHVPSLTGNYELTSASQAVLPLRGASPGDTKATPKVSAMEHGS